MPDTKTKVMAYVAVAIVLLGVFLKNNREKVADKIIPPENTVIEMDPNAILPATTTIKKASVKPLKPLISAESYLVANLETGEIYTEHNSKEVFPIASLSKLITSIVSFHEMSKDQKITITQSMLDAYGDAGHLVLGENFSVSELFFPLLLESSNDAAEALAQSYGYDDFIQKMNNFVSGIGMNSTSFKDSSGLSVGNISNAKDLFILAKYIYEKEKPILEISRLLQMEIGTTTEHGYYLWKTINPFPGDPHFIGGKTGRTIEAKESMISLFSYPIGDREYPIAIIVLRSNWSTREIDTSVLFEQVWNKLDKK